MHANIGAIPYSSTKSSMLLQDVKALQILAGYIIIVSFQRERVLVFHALLQLHVGAAVVY